MPATDSPAGPAAEKFVTVERHFPDGSVFRYTGPASYIGKFAGHVPAKGA